MNGGWLDGAGMKRLRDALVSAFPTWDALERMFAEGFGESLEAIVAKDGVGNAAHKLIVWAQSRSMVDQLLTAAREANPGSKALDDFAAWYRQAATPPV